jgi:hypothetical protein
MHCEVSLKSFVALKNFCFVFLCESLFVRSFFCVFGLRPFFACFVFNMSLRIGVLRWGRQFVGDTLGLWFFFMPWSIVVALRN